MENGYRILSQTDISNIDASKQNQLGSLGVSADGRMFVYALVGGTTTVPTGSLMLQPTAPANSTGLALSTANTTTQLSGQLGGSGSSNTTILVVNGATAVTQDQFADGYLEVLQTSGSGNGPTSYRINGNTAAAAAGIITVSLADPLTNASVLVPGTDTVNLVLSPWGGVVASTTAGLPVGVLRVQTPNTAAQQYYAWLQTNGECVMTLDATTGGLTVGGTVYQSTTTAGTVSKTAPTLANGTAYGIGLARATAAASTPVSVVLQLA